MVPAEGRSIRVELVYCPRPGEADVSAFELHDGATVADAVKASGVLERHGLDEADAGLSFGIWGKVKPLTAALRERDRVEIYRPLQVDPKEARRQRYRRQGRPVRPKA